MSSVQERHTISNGMLSVMDNVTHCFSILNIILTDFFEDDEPMKLGLYEIGKLESLIRVATDEAAEALREYSFTVGEDNGSMYVKECFKRADKAILARNVERMFLSADKNTRSECICMEDEDAIEFLKSKS